MITVGRVIGAPVIVELFESQGCSSCPPAERTMEILHEEFQGSIVPLSYHVDYWDFLGWKDTFSDALYTRRQRDYGNFFGKSSIYTPEMVIQGEVGFVGSDLKQARREIRSHLASPLPDFHLSVTPEPSGAVHVSVQLSSTLAGKAHELVAVLYENAPAVHVLRGENRGVTMSGSFAVRTMATMPALRSGHSSMTLGPGPWKPQECGVAVLVRGTSSHVIAAESSPLLMEKVHVR